MEIQLLVDGYKKFDNIYEDFIDGTLIHKDIYFSDETVYIEHAPNFPIYMAKGDEEQKKRDFLEAFNAISASYLNVDREILLDERFWHSILLTQKRSYLLNMYPEIKEDKSNFNKIVLKKFDWENYIYKTILGAQYVTDNFSDPVKQKKYFELIIENLDLYNYIIKYEIFRNDVFLINILAIIDELDLSKVMKAKIKGRDDLGDDERYGRRVIFEFNKSYPIVMSPMLKKDDLKKIFIEYLSYYYDTSDIVSTHGLEGSRPQKELITSNRSNHSNYVKSENSTVMAGIQEASRNTSNIVSKETDEISKDDLTSYLDRFNLEYIDHRKDGGSIWVIGDRSIKEYLRPLESNGVYFQFKPIGSKVTNNKSAWFWY